MAGGVSERADLGLAAPPVRAVQRRVVRTLVAVQLLGGAGVAIGVALGALTAAAISGSDAVGGLAATCLMIGVAASAMPVARAALRFGRRPALASGFACGALGSGIVALAAWTGRWPLLLLGMLLFGCSSTATYAGRYAATDLAEPSRRASQLALVVWPATVGVVLGPNLAESAQRAAAALRMTALAGPFVLAGLVFAAAAALVVAGLRPDPLRLARALAGAAAAPEPEPEPDGRTRRRGSGWWPARSLRGSTQVRWALCGISVNHAAMNAIMVMSPLDMHEHHYGLSAIGMVISGHLAGMYVLSPAVGRLADRIGFGRVLAMGTAGTAAAAVLTHAGSAGRPGLMAAGLFVLGVGWSCSLIAGSSLLTEHALLDERPAVQGLSDLAMDIMGAAASVSAGLFVALASFGALTDTVAALTALVVVAMVWGRAGAARTRAA